MTLLEELTAHKGGLVCLKSELFWYGGRGWDGIPERVCLLMDSARTYVGTPRDAAARTRYAPVSVAAPLAACLLIDGCPHWVWIAPADVELL